MSVPYPISAMITHPSNDDIIYVVKEAMKKKKIGKSVNILDFFIAYNDEHTFPAHKKIQHLHSSFSHMPQINPNLPLCCIKNTYFIQLVFLFVLEKQEPKYTLLRIDLGAPMRNKLNEIHLQCDTVCAITRNSNNIVFSQKVRPCF